ncbi:MAG: decarboxylating 6-phosphogluconate dehydrogenase [Armatimonadetes bacterium]|nr:decarboxylating 6-phosphogluconate dehydrogenase [Armatimonadota bacterium]HOM80553.1 decarboxylating 6-phosphogluconate dehydrogenase [Armatimonadota bacterium]
MEVGIYGLGRMGANMARRLVNGGHRVVVFNRSRGPVEAAAAFGAVPSDSLADFAGKLSAPRIVWLMLPAGDTTESAIQNLLPHLEPGDAVVDGANSNYKDTIRRAALLKEKGFHYVDVGTSGGIWGLTEGYSLMIGGEAEVVARLRPLFETLAPAPDRGWGHVGPNGAGHFVKMVHNGVEYGMMQAFAEGFNLMHHKEEFDLDLHQIAEIWRFGSVVRSWLLDLIAHALEENPELEGIAPFVADSGEGRWTVIEGVEQGVPLPVISLALSERFRSQEEASFADKLLAAMRKGFGGHAVKSAS